MPQQPIPMDPKYILDLIVKRRWILMTPFFLSMAVGIWLAITLPQVYQASTLILIQPQRVPREYVRSIVSAEPNERISTLSQQVLSRTNLETIINDLGLFNDDRNHSMYMEEKVNSLRRRIKVTVSNNRGQGGGEAFSIAFEDRDPDVAMKTTNALASYFIGENLKLRESQAIGTSEFLDAELQSMKARLETVEAQLKQYREAYMGELPEQLVSNLQILGQLQERLSSSQKRLTEAKMSLSSAQNRPRAIPRESTSGTASPELTDINQMRMELQRLMSRYTEIHPDIVRLKKRIEEAEKQSGSKKNVSGNPSGGGSSGSYSQEQYVQARKDIRLLEDDIADTIKQIKLYEKRVENTPKREQELLSLRRDYQNIQAAYDSLLARRLEADLAVKIEIKRKGEQFIVLDPAKRPQKPIRPDMKKLFVMFVGAGLAIGGGAVFLLEYMNETFVRIEDLEKELSLPVLCAVPTVVSKRDQLKKNTERIIFACFGLVSLASFTLFFLLTQKGVAPTLAMIKKVANL